MSNGDLPGAAVPSLVRFLGPQAAQLGPFGVLGLVPGDISDAAVDAAMARQLDRVNRHRENGTADAAEVRRQIVAAAMTLRDPAQRQQLAAQWARAALSNPTTQADHDPEDHTDDPGFDRALLPLVAVGILALIALAALLALLVAARFNNKQPQSAAPNTAASQPAPSPATASPPSSQTPSAPTTPSAAAPPPTFADAPAAFRGLRAAVQQARKAPLAAVPTFKAAYAQLEQSWWRLEPQQRRASVDAVVEMLYMLAQEPEGADDVVNQLIAGVADLSTGSVQADRVSAAAWSAGVLSRLSRETSLRSTHSEKIRKSLVAALGDVPPEAAFEAGMLAAMRRLPLTLLPGVSPANDAAAAASTKSFVLWCQIALAASPDTADQERLVVDALDQLMTAGPEPDADPAVFAAIQTLATRIAWRRAGPARARLLEWLRDPRISSADLHVLTSSLASGSAAEGITAASVLTASAGPTERELLRASLASAWSMAESASGLAGDWAHAAAEVLRRTADAKDEIESLAAAVELARLNQAARLLWKGDAAAASSLVAGAGRELERMKSGATAPARQSVFRSDMTAGTDGQWALAYLSAGMNIPVRIERLDELEKSNSVLGQTDAEVLIEAACFAPGGDGKVRATAQRVAAKFSNLPAVTNAMLETLPRAPKIESVSRLIERISGSDLPDVNDPSWMLVARRALVARLIEQIAGGAGGSAAAVDQLSRDLAESYAPLDTPPGEQAPVVTSAGIDALWRAMRSEADSLAPTRAVPIPLTQIDDRRAGRKTLASGPVQAWAAQQAGVAELFSYIVVAERPARAAAAAGAMQDLSGQRRASRHIFMQIHATERAMLRLWLVRFGQEAAWPGA